MSLPRNGAVHKSSGLVNKSHTPPLTPKLSKKFKDMNLTLAELDIEECVCSARCETVCEDNDMEQTVNECVCSAKCVTMCEVQPGREEETSECICSARCKDDSHDVIKEQTLGIKYCPSWERSLPEYSFVPYKPRTSRKPEDIFSFGINNNTKEDQEDVIINTVEPSLEPVYHVESVVGRGSHEEDPYHHGIKVIPAPQTPTISEKGMEEGEELGMPCTGGYNELAGHSERGGRGQVGSSMEEGAAGGRIDVMSRISTWELLNREEGGTGLNMPQDDEIGGRRKSQKFLDLCGQFVDKEDGIGRADGLVESVQRSVDTLCSFSNFSSLRDNWDRVSGDSIKGKIWKQRKLGLDGGVLPLVKVSANRKRGGGGGGDDKGSAAKKRKQL